MLSSLFYSHSYSNNPVSCLNASLLPLDWYFCLISIFKHPEGLWLLLTEEFCLDQGKKLTLVHSHWPCTVASKETSVELLCKMWDGERQKKNKNILSFSTALLLRLNSLIRIEDCLLMHPLNKPHSLTWIFVPLQGK